MKNKFKFIIFFLSFLATTNLQADEFIFETEEIDIVNNGKHTKHQMEK